MKGSPDVLNLKCHSPLNYKMIFTNRNMTNFPNDTRIQYNSQLSSLSRLGWMGLYTQNKVNRSLRFISLLSVPDLTVIVSQRVPIGTNRFFHKAY